MLNVARNIAITRRTDGYLEVQWDYKGSRWASPLHKTMSKAKAYRKNIKFCRTNSHYLSKVSHIPAGFNYS